MQTKELRIAMMAVFTLAVFHDTSRAATASFPARGDDLTQSLGQYQIVVNPVFQVMMAGYPGYNSTTKVLTSPVLYDPATVIGRSSPLLDGSAGNAGVPVGSAGTIIGASNLVVQPGGFGPANTRQVFTQLRSLNMTGGGAAVRAGTNATTQPNSPGEVESRSGPSQNPALDFPAKSFFDVFVDVDIPPGGSFPGATNLYNALPLLVQNTNLTSFPPTVVYVHGMSTAVPIMFPSNSPFAGQTFGLLQLAGHGVFQTNSSTGTGTSTSAATTNLQNTLAATAPAPVEPAYSNWAPGLTVANSNTMIFPNQGDDITTSLGTFVLAVNPVFQPLMSGNPNWNATTKRLTSPLLFDQSTTIGRSSPLTNGSTADTLGVPVGSAGTMVASSNLTLVPPFFVGPNGTREVHTEIRSLNLTASGAAVRAGVAASDSPKSLGEVESLSGNSGDPYWDFPAKSFFDIFVDVDIPLGGSGPTVTVTNGTPLIVQNSDLTAFPPKVIYVHGNTTAVPVLLASNYPTIGATAGEVFGILLLAGHGVGYNQNNSNDVALFQQAIAQMPEQPVAPQYATWAPNLNTNSPSNTPTNTPILLTCSSNLTVGATDGASGVYAYYTSTASGGCSMPIITYTPPSGSFFPVGTNMVSCTATDTCGDIANCSFTVTVNPPPVINCPSNMVVTVGSTNGTAVNFTVGLTGGCTPVTIYTYPYNSGDTFPLGTTYESAEVYDCNGYEGYCDFSVTVTDTNATALMVTCPSNLTVTANSASGAVVNFTVNTSGGCPPTYWYTSPYVSGSTFPVGTTTEYLYGYDSCVGYYSNYCSFTVTVNLPTNAAVNEYFSPQPLLPPVNSVYISPAQWHVLFAEGIVIRDVRHRFFTQNYTLPALGNSQMETFSSELDYQLSTDGGTTFKPATGTANVTVQVTHSFDNNGISFFDTEMTQLDLSGPGFLLRASPTLQSAGQTTVRPVPGGYMVSSFFDIFTELSTDGGNTWTPASGPGHVEMRPDPAQTAPTPEPTPLLPPPNDHYVSPAEWHALFAQGIVITNVSHKLFTGSLLPPVPGTTNLESFNSVLDLQLSTDGGNTFQFVRVTNAPVRITVANASASSDNPLYDTEMASLTASLPNGLMLRASQTQPSRGATEIDAQADGTFQISSFFDIFTELSLDGGNTWSAATNGPVRMQLTPQAPEVTTTTPNLPVNSTPYVSPAQWHALFANGIILTNVSHSGFTQTQPPPPAGGANLESFGSEVDGMISMNGGASFQPFTAPGNVAVQVNSRADLDNGTTRYFDTEMLQLDLSGGSLPNGVMIRQSPTVPSAGRTSVRPDSSGYHISSFFDIFTEVSLDGGQTWSPSVTGPGTMSPGVNPNATAAIVLTCSSNLTINATSTSGATVFYNVTATGGCSPPPFVTANPPSGGTFPMGTTTVTCTASDTCGNSTNCSFTVTVNQQTNPPIVLNCPSNMTVTATGSGGAVVYYSATASGGCSIPSVYGYPYSGSTFPVGTTTVNTTASDTCGNSTNCSFTVTVRPTTNCTVSIYCPSNIVVTAGSATNVFFTVTASDSCGDIPFINSMPPSGSTFPIGATTVTSTAYDANGTNQCSFTVTVLKTTYPPIVLTCSSNLTVNATSSTGATVFFTVTASGGCSPPPFVTANPPSGSTFPVGTTTVTSTASDTCGSSTNCSFTVTVVAPVPLANEYFSPINTLPPTNTVYISPALWHALYNNGIIIRDVRHRFFTQNYAPPTLGNTLMETFGSELDFSLSTDGGNTYQPATGAATVTVQVTHSQDYNGTSFYNTEMTQLNLTGPGFLLRESPTLQSTGQTTIRPVSGGYMISSFFDIFTEVSLDGGNTWTPSQGPGHVEMRPDPLQVPGAGEPTPLLPAPNDAYISPAQWHALYANGIVIRNVSHKLFTSSLLPPVPGGTNNESFNSILDLDVSMDSGKTFQSVRVSNAPVQITVINASASSDNPIYDTVMTALNLTTADNGLNLMLRTSPTLPSRGMTEIDPQSGGTYQITSFFDIFTELSLDGGNTWSPAVNGPVRMQLTSQAPEVAATSGNLPLTNSPYVSPAQWHAAYANGVYITNVDHRAFTANYPPPAAGGTNTENFNSMVDGMISTDGGHTFAPFTAPAGVTVNVASHSSLDNGNTRFFDTEMTTLNLSGGNLPAGIMVRESPSKASLGRTSVRNDAAGYHVSSFFDIFTEISLDGGNTWSPATTQPVTMAPSTNTQAASLQVDLAVTKTVNTNSATVGQGFINYTITVTNLGPNTASNVVVTDLLPAGVTYDYWAGYGTTNQNYNPTNGAWTIGSIAPGAGMVLSIGVTAAAAGTWTNTATLTSSTPADTNATNNSASAVLKIVVLQADLAVTKGVSTNVIGPYTNSLPVVAGQLVYFQIGIANNGPNTASNVVINDLLPPGLTYVTNISGANGFTYNAKTGVWTIGTVYPNSGTAYMYLDALCTNAGTFTNTATAPVPGGLVDPNLTNNSASAVVTVALPQADLVVTKGVSTNGAGPYTSSLSVVAGQTMYFQIGIGNNGPNTASNVVINDLLPPGLNYVTNNAAGNPFTYNAATGLWTIGTVYPGGGTSFMYLYAIGTNTGAFTNTATVPVPGGLIDPNLTNNSASAIVKIYPVYSLSGFVRGCQTNGSAVPFTTVNLTGATTGSTLSGTNGFFSFSNLLSGSYTVTPVQPGNTFTPASATVTLNANTTLPVFQGAVGQIRGRLSYGTNGAVIAGALVKLSGATNRTMLTDKNGVYAFTNTPPGTYTVTPVATNGYSFTPTNAVVIISVTNCTGQASFSAANRKVLLVALEVVQVSQDWSNSVPLIQAKKTFVRAHLQLPTNGPAVLIQGARLYGMGAGGVLPGSPLTPYAPGRSPDFLVQTTNASALRGTFNNSLNFDVPPSWTTGTITLQLVATNNVTVVPTNTVSATSSVLVTFVNTVVPPLKFFGFNLTNWDTLDFQTVNAATYATVPARVTSIYPVPDITATRSVLVPPSTLNVPQAIPLTIPAGDRTAADWALLNANAKLLQMQALDWLLSLRFGYTNWIYCGILAGPSPGTLGWAGAFVTSSNTLATRAQNVSSSFLQPTLYGPGSARQTIPHEIGHNLGFPHDVNFNIFGITAGGYAIGSCNTGLTNGYQFPTFQPIPPPNGGLKPTLGPMTNGAPNSLVYGLDTFTVFNFPGTEPVANPNNCFDMMSYCRSNSPLERWNSTANYILLRNAINTQFPPPPPPPPPGPPRQWRFIRGFVDADTDIGGFEPFWTVTSTASTAPPAPPSGNYVAAMLDANGNVIEAIPFTPVPFIIEETEAEEDLFSIPLIDNPAIHQVELVDMLNNTIVANIVAPTNLPSVSSVTLSATNGGPFTGTGPLVVHWLALDANSGAQLSYIIQYSTDGGNTWDTLDVDWTGTSYQVASSYLQATTQGMIRVIASDGFNSSAPAESSTFTIPNHPPTVSINSPADGAILIADGQAVFDVAAIDPQDGPLDGASVQWSSSLDGVLGYGAVLDLEADLLSEGTHVITVTATDSEGLHSSAQVTIYVLTQPPPALTIEFIGNQLLLSWPSSVTNYVLESTTSLAPSNWTSVTNLPASADITQTVNLNQSNTNRFFRLRMP